MHSNRGKEGFRKIYIVLMVIGFISGLEAKEEVIYKLKIRIPRANIRAEPSLGANIITQAAQGAVFESDQKQREWFRVLVSQQVGDNIKHGYLHQSVVEVLEEIENTAPEIKPEEKPEIQKKAEVVEKKVTNKEVAWVIQGGGKKNRDRREAEGGTGTRKKRDPIALRGGVIIGAGIASLAEENSEMYVDSEKGSIFGYQLGAYLSFNVNDYLEIQPEISFVKKGGRQNEVWYGHDYIYHSDYIEMPVLAKLSYNAEAKISPFIALGPFVALRIGGKIVVTKGEYEDENKTTFRRFDYGLAIGGGANIKINEKTRFNVGLRYSIGLINNYGGQYYFGAQTRIISIILGFSLM